MLAFCWEIFVNKQYTKSSDSEKQLAIAATQTTESCPTYEEISPATNATPSADVDDIDTVDNQAYAPIRFNLKMNSYGISYSNNLPLVR